MGFKVLTITESVMIADTINSFSELNKGMDNTPIYIDRENPVSTWSCIPRTNLNLGFAVLHMPTNKKFELLLKECFGSRSDVMTYLKTHKELAKENKEKFQIDWSLRIWKEKTFFKTKYTIQSKVSSNYGNSFVSLGIYEGNKPDIPVVDMFLEMR